MAWEIRQILLGVHVLLAIVWVGGILFISWGVYPAARTMSPPKQRLFFRSLMQWTHWPFTLAGAGVIATGVLLGTAAGPIRHWYAVWYTSYGKIWLASLIIALGTLSWGAFVGFRQAMKVFLTTRFGKERKKATSCP